MSSILKALKKLESEAPDRTEDAAPSLHRAMSVRRTLHGRFQKARLMRHLTLALAGALLLAVGAGIYLNRHRLPIVKQVYPDGEIARTVERPPKQAVEAEPTAQPTAPATPPTTAAQSPPPDAVNPPRPEANPPAAVSEPSTPPQPIHQTPPKSPPVRRPTRRVAPKPVPPRPAPEPKSPPQPVAVAEPDERPADSPAPARRPEPADTVEMADLIVEPSPPAADLPATPSPATEAAPGIPDRYAGVAQQSDPRFHIQALVWSPEPAGRMAMVNGSIVKTGGLVNEARIVHIGENFLIFQENGTRWRQPFRVK